MAKKIDDIYNLSRFINTQSLYYSEALSELQAGHKKTHWIWFIFPQLKALGYSENAKYYGISDLLEAKAYVNHTVLRARLIEVSEALLSLESSDAEEILGWPDNLKLKSCMTLFELADKDNCVYIKVLEKFFNGERDKRTLELLRN